MTYVGVFMICFALGYCHVPEWRVEHFTSYEACKARTLEIKASLDTSRRLARWECFNDKAK